LVCVVGPISTKWASVNDNGLIIIIIDLRHILGMIFLQEEPWKEQRRFSIRHLRDFGFGKQARMESIIHEELNELMSRVRQQMADGQQCVLHMHTFFNLSVLNVLWTLMAGVRYSHDDETLQTLIQKTESLFKSQKVIKLSLAIFPFLRKLFPGFTGETEQIAIYHSLQDFFRVQFPPNNVDLMLKMSFFSFI
jgi:methyl farnesoate epoxidase/farnesoate epoxidase